MIKETITMGEALIAYNTLTALSQQIKVDYLFRIQVGRNAAALQPVVAPALAERPILERQFAQPPKPADPKEAEGWKPWTPAEVAASEKEREKAWQAEMALPVEIAVPGLSWAELETQDKKVGIGGDVVAYWLFLLTGVPDAVHKLLAEASE